MAEVTFILGGCRSGKSRYALETARNIPSDQMIFIATSVPFDEEMRARVTRHQAERGSDWTTVEAPLQLPEAIETHGHNPRHVVLVDCLTFWINNLLMESAESSTAATKIPRLIEAIASAQCPLLLVSNEVGAGIVPENQLARIFRDAVGSMNQAVAACASRVFWVVAGIPIPVKNTGASAP
jgi:adenosylcobinamide kinase/adenosylcobinamide-phosphate guanylyltransferase